MKKILTGVLLSIIITTGISYAETSRDVFIGKWILTGGTEGGKKVEMTAKDSGFFEFKNDDSAILYLVKGSMEKREEFTWELETDALVFTDKNGGKEHFKFNLSENNTVFVLNISPGSSMILKRAVVENKVYPVLIGKFLGTWKVVKTIGNGVTAPLKENESIIFKFKSDGTVILEAKTDDKLDKEKAQWTVSEKGKLTIIEKNGREEITEAVFSENDKIMTMGGKDNFYLVMIKISSEVSPEAEEGIDTDKDDSAGKK